MTPAAAPPPAPSPSADEFRGQSAVRVRTSSLPLRSQPVVPARIAASFVPVDEDELPPTEHTINFHRRPSAGALPEPATSRSRNLVSAAPPMPPSPSPSDVSIQMPPASRTRAPLESFASVEMMQGQRSEEMQRRGSETWGSETGRYEGRGFSRTPELSEREMDQQLANMAFQLRNSIEDRRPSIDDPIQNWRRPSLTPTRSPVISFPAYSLPRRPTLSEPYCVVDAAVDSSNSDDGYDLGVNEFSSYIPFYSSTEKLAPGSPRSMQEKKDGWRTEIVDSTAAGRFPGISDRRPSIVSLPTYPAPSGSLARSWKFKRNLKKVGVVASWVTLATSLGAHWAYLVKRSEGMARVESSIPGRFWMGWIMLSVEFLIALIVGIQAVWDVTTYRSRSGASKSKLRLVGEKNLPTVDVLIISSGHQDQLTFDCAVAAASMEYAAHRFRVMVIDPTGSADLERDIVKHAKVQGCPQRSYHRRQLDPKAGEVAHSRAGSLNFAAREAGMFPMKGPGEFIAVFEADVIPERNYLRAALPLALSNPKVALVKTGHGFINLPLKLSQSTSTLIEASEPKCDSRSGFLMRRSALVEINGFPAGSWVPDGHAEALFQGRGYVTVETDEVLQWGMARPTYGTQVHQMMVNRLGPLRTAAKLGFFCGGQQIKLMPFGARVRAVWRALQPIFSLVVLLLTIAYPLMFTWGDLLVLTPNLDSLNILLISCLIMLVTASLHDLVWTSSTGLASPRRKLQTWVFSAPYEAVALLRLVLPSVLGGYPRGGSDVALAVVADPPRPSFWRRVGWLVIDPHSDVIFAFLASMGFVIWRPTREHLSGRVDIHQTALTILLTVAWPSMVWVDLLYGSLVPYTCLMFPSRLLTTPRETFIIRDAYSSVARPKHAFKTARPFKVHRLPQFVTAFVLIGWSIAAVVLGVATKVFA